MVIYMVAWIIDGILLLIVFISIAYGARKGLISTVIRLAGYVLAVAAATMISKASAEYVYIHFVQPSVMSVLETKIDAVEYDIKEQISKTMKEKGLDVESSEVDTIISGNSSQVFENSVLTKEQINDTLSDVLTQYYGLLANSLSGVMPEDIIDKIKNHFTENNGNADNGLTAFSEGKKKTAEYLESAIIRPILIKTVKLILFGGVFAIAMLIVNVIARMARIIRKIPVVGGADRFLGGVLGFLQGTIIMIIISAFVIVIIKLSNDSLKYLNSNTISHTYLFKFIYSIILKILA